MKEKIFVAMSGGVDSSVTAALLVEQGCDVEGITMCFELPEDLKQGNKPSCCGIESIQDARQVAKALGIKHHVLNYGDVIETTVIRNFVDEYAAGRTPNPCVRCNQYMKFARLWEDCRALGAQRIATGHYARIEEDVDGWWIKKGKDVRKDQSYFLYGIPRAMVPFILFPLGAMEKDEVRRHAKRFDLPVAQKKDSQDICFVPQGRYQDVLEKWGGLVSMPGPFVDQKGRVVGAHRGVAHYTIGQRDGLGIALGEPVYVNRIDARTNTVFVGPKDLLLSRGLEASVSNLLAPQLSQEKFKAGIKIRYNHADISGMVELRSDGRVRVVFDQPQSAVTPGQSVVFYDGDRMIGGAVIDGPLEE